MSIAKRTLRLLAAGLYACAFQAGAADAAAPQLEQIEDWGVRCVTPAGGGEICELAQDRIVTNREAGKDAAGQWLAGVVLGYAPGNNDVQMLIRTRVPVGVAPGVQFSVPGMAQPARIPFNYCDEKGCSTIRIGLDPGVVQKIKESETASESDPKAPQPMLSIVLVVGNGQSGQFRGVDIPLSTKGFTRAISRLKAPPAAAQGTDAKK